MASSSQATRVGIQVFLAIVIAGLAYWLYVSITEPWEAVERQQELTEQTRARMDDIRVALINYQRQYNRYPLTLDSVVTYVRTDSVISARQDSVFGPGFTADSMVYSPRSGQMFEYAVNDTARVKTYRLKDPNSNDQIGTLDPDPTRLNAASWE